MTNNARVFNLTRHFYMKLGQVEKSIEKSCSFVWVIRGETFRDATPAEAVHMRNEQAKVREPLPQAEIPGLIFQPPSTGQAYARAGYELMMRANNFCGLAQ